MGKIWKNMCQNLYRIYLRNSVTKNRFLQHVQKTEYINWASFRIPHAAQRKFFPKCNFFSQEFTKRYRGITYFLPKSQRFAFSVPFNLTEKVQLLSLWLGFLNLTRFWFSVSYICFLYTAEKNQRQKGEKKLKIPTYLPILFSWSM